MIKYIKPNLAYLKIETKEYITSLSNTAQFDKNIYQENDEVVEWEDLFN